MSTRVPNAELARQLVLQHPNHSIREIARILHKRYPRRFNTYEDARQAVRSVVNPAGKKRGFKQVKKQQYQGELPPLPESKAKAWEPFVIDGEQDILILSDIHIPYHDPQALDAALKQGDGVNPTIVLLNGDTFDNHSLSKFEGNPENKDYPGEVQAVRDFLKHIRARYPQARIIFKMGNHDEWYWRYLWRKAPELIGAQFMAFDKVIEANEHNVEIVADQRIVMAGKLPILHGHEWRGGISAPVNPARGAFLRAIDCCLQGHLHRASEHTETTLLGRMISTWSTGCLCHTHPEYARINRWSQGFATVRVTADGEFDVDNRRILKGKVL